MNLKRQVTKTQKTICFDCRTHASRNKDGNCNICNGTEVFSAPPSLRIPRKNKLKEWEILRGLAMASLGKTTGQWILGFWKYSGFGKPSARKRRVNIKLKSGSTISRVICKSHPLPKRIREKAHRENALTYIKALPTIVVDFAKPL